MIHFAALTGRHIDRFIHRVGQMLRGVKNYSRQSHGSLRQTKVPPNVTVSYALRNLMDNAVNTILAQFLRRRLNALQQPGQKL